MPSPALQIRNAFRDFVDLTTWHAPFAVTLTLRQKRMVEDERGRSFEVRLTPDRASQNFRHFMKLLNARIYGKAASRFDRSVNVVPILEGGNGNPPAGTDEFNGPQTDQLQAGDAPSPSTPPNDMENVSDTTSDSNVAQR